SIPQEVKQQRLDAIMELQQGISEEIQNEKVGSVLKVMVDREEDDCFVGRTQWDSPEVDPEVMIAKDANIKCGEFCNVKVTKAMPFELIGVKQ
ncbi:MAG: 30S ribosomal protein S12 methylthiotransferase RimO, partial [Paramuribaculum sp.]|nr:30S ribosomal protein S12 methylthiotransferase RimO [Paramuribaculum sp.]